MSTTTSTATDLSPRDYSAVRVVGSLLTADLIGRIGSGDPKLKGLRSEDYGLVPGRRLGEAASRRWEELLGVYRAFQQQLAKAGPDESLVTLTRERWLLPLFDALGFGRLQYRRGGLAAEGRTFPVSHLWNNVPIHLVAWERDLDKKRGGNGSAGGDRAPQSMLQDFLNSSDAHLWGIVSNGQKLRLLRDAASLAEAAFVEFDLESMFDGELYSDFVLLFALAHASRFEPHTPEAEEDDEGQAPAKAGVADCWIERWRVEGDRTGIRFRDKLRDGLQAALEELGTGFLEANEELREKLRTGEVSRHDLRDELLRLAYQVLFLFVAEDKGALLDPDADEAARERYRTYFSTARLRRIALERVGDRHDDLWRTLLIVLDALGSDEGRKELALPALGGLYFTAEALGDEAARPELLRGEGITLSNQRLLAAVRHLTRVKDESGRWQQVDYQHLDAEELGSVYESLLELIPYVDSANRAFELRSAAGNDRKTTGSYYTPSSLVETLLDSALDPVIEQYSERGVPDDLLKITVCDPACGSGHFLVAAARRIARAYAVLEAGDEEPTPDAITRAMPKVVRHCIYGVDLNPLAVELTKVSLWLASLEPGKPLAFLDGHIKVGNALLGATPKLLDGGIPDGAFKALEGDDKKFVGVLKKQNKQERQTGQISVLAAGEGFSSNVELAERARRINRTAKPGLAGIREQARQWRELEASPEKQRRKRVADAWCAAFVWPKRPDAPAAITTETVRQLEEAGGTLTPEQTRQLDNLVKSYHFFHWHLEFPEVFPGIDEEAEDYNPDTGWQGGFTCVLGNPPWERIAFDDKEFFDSRAPEVLKAKTTAERKSRIKIALRENQELKTSYLNEVRAKRDWSQIIEESGLYKHSLGGRLTTQATFVEKSLQLILPTGNVGIIVPTSTLTATPKKHFWDWLISTGSIRLFLDFENSKEVFKGVHRSTKFSLTTLTNPRNTTPSVKLKIGVFLQTENDLRNPDRIYEFPIDALKEINPKTKQLPLCRSRKDVDLLLEMSRFSAPHLEVDPWVGLTSEGHSREYLHKEGSNNFPLYEGKMIHQFDSNFATYNNTTEDQRTKGNPIPVPPENKTLQSEPRFWAKKDLVEDFLQKKGENNNWVMVVRDYVRSTDERTAIAAAIPKTVPIQPLNGFTVRGEVERKIWALGCINSAPYDYMAKLKTPDQHFNVTIMSQVPIPHPKSQWIDFVTIRVLELTYTAPHMEPFARDLGDSGAPFAWDDERRFLIRCELDAAFFHLYGIERDDVAYIMETFPIVKKKDLKAHGSYRTKDTILDIYDAMAKAIETGEPYQTVLDPPPGEGPRHPARD